MPFYKVQNLSNQPAQVIYRKTAWCKFDKTFVKFSNESKVK